jgi:tRNA threonylcarbamoyladenosine modification (KEOPS) complex  Pcc1 subunit
MSAKAKANVRLKFTSQKQILTILNALAPEAQAPPPIRANIKLEQDDLFLVLVVEAEDTIALRATLNAYLRWINSTIKVMDAIDQA